MKISTYFLLLLTLFFTACGGGGSEKSPTNSAQFLSVSFTPAATDQAISTEKIVTVSFSGTIDSTTVDGMSVYIEDTNTTHVPAAITVSANKISIIPTDYFSEYTSYTLVVTTVVSDLDGLKLKDDFTFVFTTSTGPDISAPTLVSYTPEPETSVAPSSHIIMAFDEMIVAQEAGLLELRDSDTNVSVAGVTTVSVNEIRFAPANALAYEGNYTATLLGGVSDVAGNEYNGTLTSWDFSIIAVPDTLAPSLLLVTPADGTSADKATDITVAFDEELTDNAALIEVSFSGTNTIISGTSTINDNALDFVPDSELIPEEDYTITLQGSVEDLAGNAYMGVISWDFSVNPLADITAPSLLSVTPTDGTSADKATDVIMAFDEELASNVASLEVRDSGSSVVAGTSTIETSSIRFTPDSDLISSEDYTVILLGSVQDLTGNTYVGTTSWDFAVNPLVDSTVPSLLSLTPVDGTSVDKATDIIMTFDEELADNTASLEVRDSGNSVVSGTSTIDNNTLTFVPDDDLIPDEDYTVTLLDSAQDIAGNTYAGVTSWTFSVDPIVGTILTVTNIKLKNGKVNIEFYEKLDASSVAESDLLINAGVISFSDFKVTSDKWQIEFVPDTALVGDETFTISGNVQDASGNIHNGGIARDYSAGGILSIWDVKQQGDKVNVKFWEIPELPDALEVLDPTTVDASDFQINGGAITFSSFQMKNDYEVEFTSDTPLTGDEVITISGDIQDKAGNFHNYNVAVQHTFR